MTEAPPRRRIKPPGPFGVIAGSLGLFLAVLILLAFQLRMGRDPALGAGSAPVAAVSAPRQILIRRVIVTRVVTHVRRAPATPAREAAPAPRFAPAAPAAAPAPAAPAPRSAPAPAPAAPAPAPAAPLTTRSS